MSEYSKIVEKVRENKLKKTQNFILRQFSSIENRIKNKGIRSVSNLKQEMLLFCEFIQKK